MHNAMPQLQPLADDPMSCQMPAFRQSTSMTFPLPSQLSDSSMTCQTPVQQQRPLETSMSGLGHSCQHNLDTVCAVCIHPCLTCILPAASVCLRTLAEKSVVIGSQGYLLCASPKQCRLYCANADLGQYVANSVSRPTANSGCLPRQAYDPRGQHSQHSSI